MLDLDKRITNKAEIWCAEHLNMVMHKGMFTPNEQASIDFLFEIMRMYPEYILQSVDEHTKDSLVGLGFKALCRGEAFAYECLEYEYLEDRYLYNSEARDTDGKPIRFNPDGVDS